MTQDELIAMAKEVGCFEKYQVFYFTSLELVTFAKLVAEKATEEANERANASWALMCEKMVAFEREACAKVCEELSDKHTWEGCYADECAIAIRARGQQ